ncbi:MAG: signal peptidase II [Chloroflexi bacterium]|nr:MAG: signal peptidase II [Chloroflexota bacterium]MBL1193376.1 signal peptidase II [Chloroflexota bacterium]NOH10668.1 signal peptidase II [Chloroflexota bacterium]
MTESTDIDIKVENKEEHVSDMRQPLKGLWGVLHDHMGLVSLAFTILAVDQATKEMVRQSIPFSGRWLPDWLMWLEPYARIVNWRNTGAAFGMFQDASLIFTILAFVVIAVIFYYYPRVPGEDWPLRLAMGMQLGGAMGNLTDRLSFGYVTDFVSIGRFPVFNVADSSIFIGTIVLIVGVWWTERQMKQRQEQEESQSPPAEPEPVNMSSEEAAAGE